jgi:ribokinase
LRRFFHKKTNRFHIALRGINVSGQKPIVVVGSINTDLVAVTRKIPAIGETVTGADFQIHPGGKGANQAVAVARLGYPVRLIGRLGRDVFGTQLRTYLESAGVDMAGVATSEGTSGVAVIVVSEQGENCIVVTPGANSKVTPEDIEINIEIVRQAGIVLAQLEIPLETVEYLASICAREGVPLILDPAPARSLPPGIFKQIAWFTPNQTEAAFYSGSVNGSGHTHNAAEMARLILAEGNRGVVLKMGEHGAYLASQEGIAESIPAFKVKAIDTTAAGDAFNGGFATGLMKGKPPLESARFASAVAAISVTRSGAQPSMPTSLELDRFLEESTGFKAH